MIPYADDFRANLETDPDEKLLAVFRMFDPSNEIVLSIKGDWGESERTLNVRLEDAGTVQLDIQQNSSLGKRGKKKLILHYVDDIGVESVTEAVLFTTQQVPAVGNATVTGLVMTLQIIRQDPIERKMSKGIYLIPGPIKSSDNVEQLSRLRREGKHSKVEEVLRYVEPRLRSIFIDAAGTPRVFTEIEGYDKPVPISLMGTGIVRLLSITLAMSDAAGGIVLVDEIENGLHHSVMQSVWDGIAEFAREFDVQVFATTHSWECARTAQQAFSVNEMVEDFRYHRVDRRMDTGEILVRTYSPESLEASFEIPLEIR